MRISLLFNICGLSFKICFVLELRHSSELDAAIGTLSYEECTEIFQRILAKQKSISELPCANLKSYSETRVRQYMLQLSTSLRKYMTTISMLTLPETSEKRSVNCTGLKSPLYLKTHNNPWFVLFFSCADVKIGGQIQGGCKISTSGDAQGCC